MNECKKRCNIMSKRDAKKISNLLNKAERAEEILLIKRSKGISKNLKRLIKLKQKIAEYEQN